MWNILYNPFSHYRLTLRQIWREIKKNTTFLEKSTIVLGKKYLRFKQKVLTFYMKIGLFWQNLYTILYWKIAPLCTTHYLSISYSNRLFFLHNSCIYREGHSLLKKNAKMSTPISSILLQNSLYHFYISPIICQSYQHLKNKK